MLHVRSGLGTEQLLYSLICGASILSGSGDQCQRHCIVLLRFSHPVLLVCHFLCPCVFHNSLSVHASQLGADKLICLHLDDVAKLELPAWLPLSDARTMLLARMSDSVCTKSMDAEEAHRQRQKMLQEVLSSSNGNGNGSGSGTVVQSSGSSDGKDFMLNLDLWHHQVGGTRAWV